MHDSNTIIKFADDTAVVSLITDDDETAYREKVRPGSVETENIWHGYPDPQKVLQLHHREHPDWLHHRLVWQLLGI
jgi:hypothetical protein